MSIQVLALFYNQVVCFVVEFHIFQILTPYQIHNLQVLSPIPEFFIWSLRFCISNKFLTYTDGPEAHFEKLLSTAIL